ncbi:MAG: phosphotransferase [Acidimicrobiia bacterium]
MAGPDPDNLDHVLALGGVKRGAAVELVPLEGGYRNTLYRLRGSGFDWVVKQYAPPDPNPLFPLLFEHEWRFLLEYGDDLMAPELVAGDQERRVLLYRYVPGLPWDGDIGGAARLLSRVASMAGAAWLRTLPSSVAELRAHTDRIVNGVKEPPVGLLNHFDVAEVPFESRLVHTDCGPGNMIGGAGSYLLIDWQCPGLGDPVEDLVAFTSPGVQILNGRQPLTRSEIDDLLRSYVHRDVVDRYHHKAVLYRARLAAYWAWRIERLGGDPRQALYRRALRGELESLDS